MKKLEEKRVALNKATSMGETILSICHPDSCTTIKHWNTIIKARFEEVSSQLRSRVHACLLCHTHRCQVLNNGQAVTSVYKVAMYKGTEPSRTSLSLLAIFDVYKEGHKM